MDDRTESYILDRKNLFVFALSALVLSACGNSDKDASAIDIDVNNVAANGSANASTANAATACESDAECTGGSICDTAASECVMPMDTLPAWEATVTEVYAPGSPVEAPDLEFHPDRNQLWIVNRRPEVEGQCTQSNPGSDRCRSLAGFTTLIDAPGTGDQSVQILEDGNSWHFMRRPPALAMGDNGNFATCGEAATGNFEDNPANFIGPSLWSTDLSVYAQPSGGNGSHLDMLHATPWCMGIAHEVDNVYWTFNGDVGSLDRYDFAEDHGPGNDDHSDGTIYRYVEGELSRVANVPSHLVIDKTSNMLYVADTGNGRVARIDITAGDPGAQFQPVYEPLADWGNMLGVTVEEVIPAGVLEAPSGIALGDGELLVSDNATGMVTAFDMDTWEPTRVLDTELGAGNLAGIEVGPNGALWFTNFKTGAIFKAE